MLGSLRGRRLLTLAAYRFSAAGFGSSLFIADKNGALD
jgi:hypothetical protein